uniref:Uncharacterized protein n=1 Tax=Moniliophthora roreri TaxID=221103 RepID=A0A0W0FFY3_MONRR
MYLKTISLLGWFFLYRKQIQSQAHSVSSRILIAAFPGLWHFPDGQDFSHTMYEVFF